MITVYHLTDAVPAALFGMFALWAAVSQRHWFVRTTVVSAALLVMLLIPAYEVLIEFGIETLVVVAGIAIWRQWRNGAAHASAEDAASRAHRGPQMSLATLLLLVVIVAVTTTVAARAPAFSIRQWWSFTVLGFVAAVTGLACVWIVRGRAAWWARLIASPFLALVLGAVMHWLLRLGNVVQALPRGLPLISDIWQEILADLWSGVPYWATTIGLGMTIICVWLMVLRAAGWFNPFRELDTASTKTTQPSRRIAIARLAAVSLFGFVSLFPLVLLYRLLTPPPIPNVPMPNPNGFDDFVAAGHMIGPADGAMLMRWDLLSADELNELIAKHAAAFDRAAEGLQKPSWHPYVYASGSIEDSHALMHLLGAMSARGEWAKRSGSGEEQLRAYWDLVRVSFAANRGVGANYDLAEQFEPEAVRGLWFCRTRLSAEQCAELAADLYQLDASREAWAIRAERQRIIDSHTSWEWHLRVILANWSGTDRYDWARSGLLQRMAQMRILIAELGIRAYQVETGELPNTLAELVPKFIPAVPQDPYDRGPVKYRVSGDTYTLYSAGNDGDDDGGQSGLNQARQWGTDGDATAADLFPPPKPATPARQADPPVAVGGESMEARATDAPSEKISMELQP